MSNRVECEWCDDTFRSQNGLDWHMENSHLQEFGLVINLDIEWRGVPMHITEKPGEYLLVLPAITKLGHQDPDTVEDTMHKDMLRSKEVLDVIKRVNEQLPPERE